MSQHFMTGDWKAGVRYLLPLIAFVLGVFVADQIQMRYKYARRLHWRQGILLAEIVILFVVGFIPHSLNMTATIFCVLCLCDAGADIPEDGWLFLCKYHVYRQLKKWNSSIFSLSAG